MNFWQSSATVFLASGLFCFFLSFPVYRFLHWRRVLDEPSARSSHSTPTLRGGGLAIVITIVLAFLILYYFFKETAILHFLFGVLIIATVSFLDDLFSVGQRWRILTQIFAVLCLYFLAPELFILRTMRLMDTWVFYFALTFIIFCVVACVNAYNFMDGINGISCLQVFIGMTALAVIAAYAGASKTTSLSMLALAVGAAALGFLPHNFPRARMFMGDVGSCSLGFIVALLSLYAIAKVGKPMILPVIILQMNYALDTGITLLRRIFRGEKWWQAHREHFYQLLTRSGRSHTFVSILHTILHTLSAVCAYFCVKFADTFWQKYIFFALVLIIWLAYFAYAERKFRKSRCTTPISS